MNSPKVDTRYFTLDFWRGVACLMVVVFHSSFYLTENPEVTKPGGVARLVYGVIEHAWVGVPMFFVISGYCITATCMAVARRGFRPGDYFLRRFRRIFPPYWIAIVLFLLFCGLLVIMRIDWLLFDDIHPFKGPSSLSWIQWIGNVTLTETWRPNVVGADGTRFFLGVAWTLCYEEQFYLVCGVLMWLSPQYFFRNCLVVTVVIFLMTLYKIAVVGLGAPNGFFFDGRWLQFACGIGVYYRLHHCGRDLPHWRKYIMEVTLFVTFLYTMIAWKLQKHQLLEELFVSSFFALALIPLFRYDRIWFSARIWRGIWVCGTMCYSFYLVHAMPVKAISNLLFRAGFEGLWMTAFITLPVCVVVAALLGWAFHCLVERRFLNSKPIDLERIFSPAEDKPKTVCALVTPPQNP
jgi:peptidoglycan/LPS O-acetylase OafA/YrhL